MKTNLLTICLISIIGLSGCFSVSVPKLPELKHPLIDNPVGVAAICPKVTACPVVDKLKKLPKDAELKMIGGKVVFADKGGADIVRQYLGAYDAVEEQWRVLPR